MILNPATIYGGISPPIHDRHVKCHACGNGTGFDGAGNFEAKARQDGSKEVKTNAKKTLADAKTKIDEHPLSLASMKQFQSFIIPNRHILCQRL